MRRRGRGGSWIASGPSPGSSGGLPQPAAPQGLTNPLRLASADPPAPFLHCLCPFWLPARHARACRTRGATGQMDRDLYAVLGVPSTSSEREIRHAFHELARKYHPDVAVGDSHAARKFIEVSQAAGILLDP